MEDKTPNEDIEQVEYNLSAFKIGWIAELMRRADVSYLAGHINKAFECWKCIYSHIKSRLDTEENKKCKTTEKRMRIAHTISKSEKELKGMKAFYYERYVSHLQEMLRKYGFDIREKESQEHLV